MTSSANSEIKWIWEGKPFSLPLTRDDVLALARAVDAEGYPKEGVTWALLQRAAWLHSHGKPLSVQKVVTSYAQPINPLWFPGGEKHVAEVARLKRIGDERGAQAEMQRAVTRLRKAAKPWEQLAPDTREVIEKVLDGRLKSPFPHVTHYWASRAPDFAGNQARKPNLQLIDAGYGFKGNVFFAEKAKEWLRPLTLVNTSNLLKAATSPGVLTPLAAGVGLLLLYAAWKRTKRR